MKNSLIFAFAIVGTLIGAGFATGQELYSFFILHSQNGCFYFVISALFIVSTCLIIYFYVKKNNIQTMELLFVSIYNQTGGTLLFLVSIVFLFICFSITVTGTGTLFYESFQLPFFIGAFVVILISYAAVLFGLEGVFTVNAVLTPFIVVSILILGLIALIEPQAINTFRGFQIIKQKSIPFIFAMLYSGYNIFSILPITISSVKKFDKKTILIGFVLSFILILATGMVILASLYHSEISIAQYEIPFLKLVSELSKYSKSIYILVLYFSMLTTGVACFYGFITNMTDFFSINKELLMFISVIVCIGLSFFGFSQLVRKLYSLFGVLGVFIMVSSLYHILKK